MDRRPFVATTMEPPRCFWAHRRARRHASTRVVSGRLFWVVPAELTAGWELVYRKRVVVVRETRIVERNGRKSEIAMVEDSGRHCSTVEITREDNAENSLALEGSVVEEPMPEQRENLAAEKADAVQQERAPVEERPVIDPGA
jgi:hypothetical protein